jgi:acetyl esterase
MCARCDEQAGRTKAVRDPAIVAIFDQLAARGLAQLDPAIHGVDEARSVNEAYFAAIAEPRASVARLEIVEAPRDDGGRVQVKVAVPHGAEPGAPGIFYAHGGGYTFGDLDTHDHVIRAIAASSALPVFAVHYRRTPEHAWPAPLDDALAVAAAMRGADWAGRFGHDPARLLAIGDSAGAHLVLTTMLALKQQGLQQFVGAGLFYGMYARRFDSWSHHAYGDGSVGLSTERMRWFWKQLMGEQQAGPADPLREPLDADLAGLPPLALVAAEVDCLLDDTLDLIETLKRQGHRHSFDLVRGAPHGFLHMVNIYPPSRAALERLVGRLAAMVSRG